MIAKKSARKKGSSSSFTKLVSYMVRADKSQAGIGQVRISNCDFEDLVLATKEIEATQALNTRSQADKTYHLIFSFPVGEQPTAAQLEDIEQTLCEAIGYAEHQRISVVHTDTDNFHVHVAINKIHPTNHHITALKKDYYRLDDACRALEKKHGLLMDNRIEGKESKKQGREAAIDIHGGTQSFKGWLGDKSAEFEQLLSQSSNWQDLQYRLAAYDVTLRKRGAGLVFSSRTEKLFCPASHVSKQFSFAQLEKKFGDFEAVDPELKVQLIERYQKMPSQQNQFSVHLWQRYQQQRQQNIHQRKLLLKQQKQIVEAKKKAIYQRYQLQKQRIHADKLLSKKIKHKALQRLNTQRQQAIAQQALNWQQQRQQIQQRTPCQTWQSWLIQQAEDGNQQALATLRANQERRSKSQQQASFVGETHAQINTDIPHQVRANGDIIYHGKVRESAQCIDVESHQNQDIELGLRLAIARFGHTLTIQGDAIFKQKVIEAAFLAQLPIQFTDPQMMQSLQQRSTKFKEITEATSERQNSVVADWINQCNQTILKTNDISLYKAFTQEDAGAFQYMGCRQLKAGRVVALYRKGEQMDEPTIVVPISLHQQRRYQQHRIGTPVKLNRLGQASFSRAQEKQKDVSNREYRR